MFNAQGPKGIERRTWNLEDPFAFAPPSLALSDTVP